MRREGSPRVVALRIRDLPLQRLRRGREGSGAGPLATTSDGRVTHCDASAWEAGVRPGATVAAALAACGTLRTAPLDPAADLAALRGLADALLALAPAVEIVAPDALLLDAGAAHLLCPDGSPAAAGERVLADRARALAAELGWTAAVAVASGRGPALALARHAAGDPRWVAPGASAGALAPLAVEALGLPAEVAARLEALGIRDVGALARLPPETLAHRFGAAGAGAARLARGEDPSPLVPYLPATLPEEAIELEAPAEIADPILFALKRLADRVAARLSGRGLGATRLKVVLKLDPRGEERLLVPLAHPTASAARWLAPAKEHLLSMRLPAAVIAVRLAAIEVAPLAAEQLAFGDRPEALDALDGVLSRLSTRLGEDALFAAVAVDRHRPEGAYRPAPFRPGSRGGAPRAAPAAPERAGEEAREAGAFRPTRLLPAPRPVVAEGEGGRLTAIRVGVRAHQVLGLEGPERLAGEWWAAAYDREYYRARLEGLGDCWLFRDGADGRLYLHGFFD
jgi:protein ImuB